MRIAVSRASGEERVVSPLELFFDPVYVFAIGQLSHHLAQLLGHRALFGYIPRSRPLGLVALAILAPAVAPLTMIAGIAASAAVLVAVAIAGTLSKGDGADRRD